MDGQDATLEITHEILTNPKLFKRLTGIDLTSQETIDTIKKQLESQNITSQDVVAALKAFCKVSEFISTSICPLVDKM